MNHVTLRRLALAVASVSLGTLASLLLIGSSVVWPYPKASAQEISKSEYVEAVQEPIPISCTPLVINSLSVYDGKFIEDGSGREVQDVAAIMLYNSADRIVPYAYVTIYTKNCQYTFNAYMIPPKSSVLVPEEAAQKLTECGIIRTFGWTTVGDDGKRCRIELEEIGMGCLCVTNKSGSKIENLMLYHRTFIPEDAIYMGGKAFETQIPYIAPGKSVLVYPSDYASGYSKIVHYEQKGSC